MSKTRFTPWIVLACIGTLAGCTSGEGGTAGNTELNVVIPNNAGQSSAPGAFDIQVVEYTIACNDGNTPGPFLDNNATFDDDVTISGVLEVLDTASSGVTIQDFGPDLTEVYVWQGFMDLPPTAGCTVQLRARDADGEVICTATETFDIAADTTTKVNVLMYCGISFQAPVGMLDLDGDFSFNVANFCPDLFVLNCIDSDIDIRTIPGIGEVAATACQTRFRDGDSSCGGTGIAPGDPDGASSCDPQTCVTTPEGLDCAPSGLIDPPVTTTVTCAPSGFFCAGGPDFGTPCAPSGVGGYVCLGGVAACAPNAVIDCTGTGTPAANCVFTGDTTGTIGGGPPGPLNAGPGGFFVACVLGDDDGNPLTPNVPLTPGAAVTCTAVTTDGDTDCDKTKEVVVTCPGLSPCQTFGGDAACQAAAGTVCVSSVCDDSSGTAVCIDTPVGDGLDCSAENPPFSLCEGGVCVSQACTSDADCETPNECTFAGAGICDIGTGVCGPLSNEAAGTSCNAGSGAGSGACDGAGACVDNCAGVICDDGNECTDDPACVSVGGPTCPPPINDDNNVCTTCASGTCLCSAGVCIDGCTVPAPVDAIGIPMACRNSFQVKAVSTFPINLENINTGGDCIEAGQPVNFAMDPTIALDTAFLQAAANTLCGLGTALQQADVTVAQIAIDAVAGATCTEQLSQLPNTPVTVVLDATVTGTCGAGGSVTINSPVSLPLPAVNLPCTAGSAGTDALQICSTGVVPIAANIDLSTPPTQTFVGVSVGGGQIQVVFQCNTSSTTEPPPGVQNQVGCSAPGPAGPCPTVVGTGNVGEDAIPNLDLRFPDPAG